MVTIHDTPRSSLKSQGDEQVEEGPRKRARYVPWSIPLYSEADIKDAIDDGSSGCPIDPTVIRLVHAIEPTPDMNVAAAGLQAEHAEVTAENERWLRSFHPSLRRYDHVHVHDDVDGTSVWLVPVTDEPRLFHTHAGGREIHYFPWHTTDPAYSPTNTLYNDPLTHRINIRRLLNAHDLSILRDIYPEAIGVRILVTGFVIFLFKSRRAMERAWNHKTFEMIGGRRVGYDVFESCVTSRQIAYGDSVSERPEDYSINQGCLGLRLKLPSGEEVVTTTTHAFVKCRRPGRVASQIADWYVYIRDCLKSFRPVKPEAAVPAAFTTLARPGNSPLGKTIWIAGTNHKVGTITKTYDPDISAWLPFSCGYRHDLSLVTDESLPSITSPPGQPLISNWGSYAAVLDGAPIFVCRMNVLVNKWRVAEGQGMSQAAQAAVVMGSEYSWDRETRSHNCSLLWRTNQDCDSMEGFSGSVLCLGRPTDVSAKAVLFQNFEAPIRPDQVLLDHRPTLDPAFRTTFKGGFLLPEEIRRSEIQMVPPTFAAPFISLTSRKWTSPDRSQRSVTGP